MAAPIRLLGFTLELSEEVEVQDQTASGVKFDTGHAVTQEWSSGRLRGGLPFDELPFLLDGVFRVGVDSVVSVGAVWAAGAKAVGDVRRPSTPNGHVYRVTASDGADATEPTWPLTDGGTVTQEGVSWVEAGEDAPLAEQRLYDINDVGKDPIQTYTAEQGDREGVYAEYATLLHFTSCQIASERTGNIQAQANVAATKLIDELANGDPVEMTDTGIIEQDNVYGTPEMVNVYVDDAAAALGTTLVRNSSVTFNLTNRQAVGWLHDRSLPSFAQVHERKAQLEVTLVVGVGPDLKRFKRDVRRGMRKFIRFEVLGPEIQAGIRYLLQWDVACQVNDAPGRETEDEMQMAEVSLAAERDATWGRTTQIRLVSRALTGAAAAAGLPGPEGPEGEPGEATEGEASAPGAPEGEASFAGALSPGAPERPRNDPLREGGEDQEGEGAPEGEAA